jgi:TPR repeat protein
MATATVKAAPSQEQPSSPAETAALLERGDRLFGTGDVASARLFYERAADAGDSQAALRLGETFDPAFLQRAQLRVPGDRGLAVFWYGRARELGADEAEILLKGMQTR